ncbi:MAG: type II toxin-antitoxin system VapC family toxin [Pseudomonadales bacterium]
MEKKCVYLETSFISYLTGRPSSDVVVAGHQKITQDWWENRRQHYDLFISGTVVDEASQGNEDAASRRLAALEPLTLLDTPDTVTAFVETLLAKHALPAVAITDAIHVAMACIHNMDYLLTWNCKHIANVDRRYMIEEVSLSYGYVPPRICTPEELDGED